MVIIHDDGNKADASADTLDGGDDDNNDIGDDFAGGDVVADTNADCNLIDDEGDGKNGTGDNSCAGGRNVVGG